MPFKPHRTRIRLLTLLALLCVGAVAAKLIYDDWLRRHALHIGAIEEVVLLPWNTTIPARMDTGAATSALDARDMHVLPDGKEIEFRLPERCGGHLVRRRLHGWRTVTSSNGQSEKRPEVEMEMQMGERRFRTHVTLTDRSKMKYPLLIGRRTLNKRFVVDVTHTNMLTPEVPEPVAAPAGAP
jgi:hypothetical protein